MLSLVIGLWLLTWVWDFTRYSWRVWRESPTLDIPTFYAGIALLVGMVLMMLWSLLHLARHLRELADGADHG